MGDMSARHLNKPIVGMASTPDGKGYWMVASDGGVFSFGDAGFHGSTGGLRLNKPIVGMASTPDGNGYWMVASDGGVFSFGDAGFHGSTGGLRLNKPIVGMASTPDGNGYWMVASDGGVFSFGDAGFHGSTGGLRLNKPIVGMASTPDGNGYWLVASDGGVFSFGDAGFHGSTGGLRLNKPIVGMASTPDGKGYVLAAGDGTTTTFTGASQLPVNTAGIPTVNPPGWTEVFHDDFAGPTIQPNTWDFYSGHPGGDPYTTWSPTHAVLGNGMLALRTYRDPSYGNAWTSAGLSSLPALSQTYGKYLVRMRSDLGAGIAYAALLWPASGASGPPEIDFAESNGGIGTTYSFLHFRQDGANAQIRNTMTIDESQWHTYGVEWTPDSVEFTVDGNIWATETGASVPTQPMVLDLQSQVWACGTSTWESCPGPSTPAESDLDIAWVVAYSYTPGS